MTIVRGVFVRAAPCCGARYAFPRYRSINFSAFEYWTDGWREMSLMPNDEGLRRCQCGRYLLLRDLVELDWVDGTDLPRMDRVAAQDLPDCIAQADGVDLEVAARLEYWRHLNHPYRQRYREHRDAEEARTRARWEAAQPETRTWWERLRGRKRAPHVRPPDIPFTFPPFEPSQPQRENMTRLVECLSQRPGARSGESALELTELLRELGQFEAAQEAIALVDPQDSPVAIRILKQMLGERATAPIRYRL